VRSSGAGSPAAARLGFATGLIGSRARLRTEARAKRLAPQRPPWRAKDWLPVGSPGLRVRGPIG